MTISKLLPAVCAFALGATCVTVRADDNPAQAAARIALAKQLFELNAATNNAASMAAPDAAAPASSKAKTKAKPQASATAASQSPATNPAPAVVSSPESQKAAAEKAALAMPATPVPSQAGPTADAALAGSDLGMKPIAAPALPISATKADRLQALLARYKADQITPEEYHQQRAAILAEP
jgi:hypothetical protein